MTTDSHGTVALPLPTIQNPASPVVPRGPASLSARIATVVAVVGPFLGLIAALAFFWGWGFNWLDFWLLLGMYIVTALGLSVGYHRQFTHRSFETNRVVQFILAAFGSMAVQGSVLEWVATHRRHHQHSDTPHDPHSPHNSGDGFWGAVRGFYHAHIGWAFKINPPDHARYVKDLYQSPSMRVASAMFPFWIVLGLAIPAVLGGLITGTWYGALLGFIWGGLVRIFLIHHVTWSVNSVCHLWGSRPYPDKDESRNNFVVGVLTMGEGWHNNHHAFPTSARHGLRWWQLDVSYWVIRAMALIGLAWEVRLPAST